MFYLKRNLPRWERALRLCLGLLVALAVFYAPLSGTLAMLGWVTAATLAGTAIWGFCPACAMFGRSAVRGSE